MALVCVASRHKRCSVLTRDQKTTNNLFSGNRGNDLLPKLVMFEFQRIIQTFWNPLKPEDNRSCKSSENQVYRRIVKHVHQPSRHWHEGQFAWKTGETIHLYKPHQYPASLYEHTQAQAVTSLPFLLHTSPNPMVQCTNHPMTHILELSLDRKISRILGQRCSDHFRLVWLTNDFDGG